MLLASCSSEHPTADARAAFETAQRDFKGTKSVCQNGPESGPPAPPPLSVADRANAEWDIAAAENIENVSLEQEWDIRLALAAELGLAPSRVDWRGIYRRRAEIARRKIAGAKQPTAQEEKAYKARIQKQACDSIAGAEQRVKQASRKLEQLEVQENKNTRSMAALAIAAALVAVGFGLRQQRKKRVRGGRILDSLLIIAETRRGRLLEREWQEIVDAHADGDEARLKSLVERAKRF